MRPAPLPRKGEGAGVSYHKGRDKRSRRIYSMEKINWFTDKQIKEIQGLFSERTSRAWGNTADELLGDSANGQLFLDQLGVLSKVLRGYGYSVKANFNRSSKSISLDLADPSGKPSQQCELPLI